MNHFAFLFIGVIAKVRVVDSIYLLKGSIAKVRVVDSIYLLKGSILTCAFLFF
jgi:hypothetical protein